MLIAIDGPAASGKGTLARRLAKYLDLSYLDTGSLYRGVGLKLIESGMDVEEAEDHNSKSAEHAIEIARNLALKDLEDLNLSCEGVGKAASIVSAIPKVREALLEFQKGVANSPNGAVLEGRDIGTVVCPNADHKFFVTASIEARAERRYKELQKRDESVIYDSVLQDLVKRDRRDSKRTISPLTIAEDAIEVDTTDMSMDDVFEKIVSIISSSTSR